MARSVAPTHKGITIDRARLDRALLVRNLTPRDLARKVGISEAGMSRIRSGEVSPRPGTVAAIARVLVECPIVPGAEQFLSDPV